MPTTITADNPITEERLAKALQDLDAARDALRWLIEAAETPNDPRVILTIAAERARDALGDDEGEAPR